MSDSLITVIAIMLTAVLLLVLPVMTMADRADDISKTDVETMTSNFVNEIRTIGKLTSEKYNKFVEELTSTGNTYDIEMEFKILDENPGKKSTQSAKDKIGENVYYSVFTTQIQEALEGENKVYNLKEGDIINVSVKNTNLTLSQSLKNFFYTVVGNDTVGIIAKVCTYLAENQVNILDISQTIVQGYFNMMMIADTAKCEKDGGTLAKELENLGKEIGVVIHCQHEDIFNMMHRV